MGMSAGTAQVLSALITGGLGFAGGALQGNPYQQRQTFADGSETDPQVMLGAQQGRLNGALNDATQRAHQPIELPSAFAQDLPTFTGGGLPMPIGVTGHDPAVANPELKRIVGGNIGSWSPNVDTTPHRQVNLLDTPQPATDFTGQHPISTNLPGYRSAVARRPLGGTDLLAQQPQPDPNDPNQQAAGAIDLLRHVLGS